MGSSRSGIATEEESGDRTKLIVGARFNLHQSLSKRTSEHNTVPNPTQVRIPSVLNSAWEGTPHRSKITPVNGGKNIASGNVPPLR